MTWACYWEGASFVLVLALSVGTIFGSLKLWLMLCERFDWPAWFGVAVPMLGLAAGLAYLIGMSVCEKMP